MASDSKEVLINEQQKRVIILNFGMPVEKFNIHAIAKKYGQQGIEVHIAEISPTTKQLVEPFPFKIDSYTKIIVQAHGIPMSDTMEADTEGKMTTDELAEIIAQNMGDGVTRIQINLGLCNGGVGEGYLISDLDHENNAVDDGSIPSAGPHDKSFAWYLFHALKKHGIKQLFISARIGLVAVTPNGNSGIQVSVAWNDSAFLSKEHLRKKFFGKLPGSKVRLIQNEEEELLFIYPYGELKTNNTEEIYHSYYAKYAHMIKQAQAAFDAVLSAIKSEEQYKELLNKPDFVATISSLDFFVKNNNIFNFGILKEHIDFKMQKVNMHTDDTVLLNIFAADFKERLNQCPQIFHHAKWREELFHITTKVLNEIAEYLIHVKGQCDGQFVNKKEQNIFDSILDVIKKSIKSDIKALDKIIINGQSITAEEFDLLNEEKDVFLSLIAQKEISDVNPRDKELIELYIQLSKLKCSEFNTFKKFIRETFNERQGTSIGFFESGEGYSMGMLLAARNWDKMKEIACSVLQNQGVQLTARTKLLYETLADQKFNSISDIQKELERKLPSDYPANVRIANSSHKCNF